MPLGAAQGLGEGPSPVPQVLEELGCAASVTQRPQRERGERAQRHRLDLLVRVLPKILDQQREARRELDEPRHAAGRQIEHLGEAARRFPTAARMRDHERDHDRKRSSRMLLAKLLPDPDDVAQHPQRHVRIAGALMLKQDVEKYLSTTQSRREKQVGVQALELLADERPRFAAECGPIDRRGHGRRQRAAQESGRVRGRLEGALEDRIVGLVGHRGAR